LVLTNADLVWYYTNAATTISNATASLGGTISTSTIESALANNVFDDVTGVEGTAGESHYRAIALRDTSNNDNYLAYKVWIEGYTRAGSDADTIYFGLETISGTPSSIQDVDDEFTPPNTANFSTSPTGLAWVIEGSPSETITPSGNTLVAGGADWVGIWLWRTIPVGASTYSNRSCTIKFQGESTGSPRIIIEKTWGIHWNKDGQISVHEV